MHIKAGRVSKTSASKDKLERYLPSNYNVAGESVNRWTGEEYWIIEGVDNAGWTWEDYVKPRLASGLIFVQDIIIGQEES